MREEEGEEGSVASRSSVSNFLKILSSYNSNVLLAALVFLLLVVLFVLLLHFYARFFWSNSDQEFSARRRRRRRRSRRRTVTTTRIIPSLPLGGFDGGVSPAATTSDDKGLDSSVISSIPLFVYEDDEKDEEEEEEECVICLGLWEAGDFGRKLRNCGHGFHVECIDMWLSSHSTCPLCRSPVLAVSDQKNLKPAISDDADGVEEEEEAELRRLQLFRTEEDENVVASDRRFSLSLAVMEDGLKTGVDNGDGDGVGEGEVRIEVLDEEINGVGPRGDRRSTSSMTSSASSSLMRMLSSRSRSECNKVFPSATQDSSP